MESKRSLTLRLVVLAVSAGLAIEPVAFAQQSAPPAQAAAASSTAPAGKTFSQQQMDELLAPIALYPDALLAQVLMASTYPLEIVEAARWQKANPNLKEKALEDALQKQSWDPSVKSLTAVPQVLTMMNEKLDWTTKLGDAFLAQQDDMLNTVQTLRKKADEAGNLKSSKELTVEKKTENNVQVIKIEQPSPEVVYVPTYNPATVYGTWWYAAPPPYYYYPPGYAYGAGLAFATGVVVGAAIWGGLTWGGGGHNEININTNRYNNFNKSNISNGNWNHNAEHRKGAAYRDNATAQKYNRGGDRQATQSRDQFRGRAEQGRSQMSQMDRGELQRSTQAADRGARGGDYGSRGGDAGARAGSTSRGGDAGRAGGASSSRGGGGFSGAGGGGASTRAASSRGGSSMSRGGGGGRGGGRR
jgi:uncharacterized membrane protein YgcG